MRPALLTFDVFGTVLDWTRGLREALLAAGRPAPPEAVDRIIDHQGAAERRAPFRRYREIAAASLVEVGGMAPDEADGVAAALGRWPPFPDSAEGLRRLLRVAPCVAMTNSDRAHRAQVEAGLGLTLSRWFCAEDLGVYKPAVRFWREVSERLGVPFGPAWWHVSAYGDYDLATARSLGLTCVLVERPHRRPGPHHLAVPDLRALADRLQGELAGAPGR